MPNSIVGRLILILVAGMQLTLVAAIGVTSWGFRQEVHSPRYPQVVERLATFISLVNRTAPEHRVRLLPELDETGLAAHWSPQISPAAEMTRGWVIEHLEKELRARLMSLGTAGIDVVRSNLAMGDVQAPVARNF